MIFLATTPFSRSAKIKICNSASTRNNTVIGKACQIRRFQQLFQAVAAFSIENAFYKTSKPEEFIGIPFLKTGLIIQVYSKWYEDNWWTYGLWQRTYYDLEDLPVLHGIYRLERQVTQWYLIKKFCSVDWRRAEKTSKKSVMPIKVNLKYVARRWFRFGIQFSSHTFTPDRNPCRFWLKAEFEILPSSLRLGNALMLRVMLRFVAPLPCF